MNCAIDITMVKEQKQALITQIKQRYDFISPYLSDKQRESGRPPNRLLSAGEGIQLCMKQLAYLV